MGTRAQADILRRVFSNFLAVQLLVAIANFGRLLLPDLSMASLLTSKGMRYLVQQHLLHLFNRGCDHKMLTERDPSGLIVTLTCSTNSPVKTKGIAN